MTKWRQTWIVTVLSFQSGIRAAWLPFAAMFALLAVQLYGGAGASLSMKSLVSTHGVWTFGLFMTALVLGLWAPRSDIRNQFLPILSAGGVQRTTYVWGRVLGLWAVCAAAALAMTPVWVLLARRVESGTGGYVLSLCLEQIASLPAIIVPGIVLTMAFRASGAFAILTGDLLLRSLAPRVLGDAWERVDWIDWALHPMPLQLSLDQAFGRSSLEAPWVLALVAGAQNLLWALGVLLIGGAWLARRDVVLR